MKRLMSMLGISAACAALAQPVQVVVPGGLGNVEGNTNMSDFLNASSFRMQMVFDASQFTGLGSGPGISNRISSISFRIDGASTSTVLYSFGGASVTLSTIPRAPDNLSAVFADNVGSDAVTIYSGGQPFGSAYFPGASPQPFAETLLGINPFYYSPSQGNLLVDIRGVEGQTLFPGALDAQEGIGDSVSRVFAVGNLASMGTPDTLGLVTRFNITVIPEPSPSLLAGIGLVLAALIRRR
jgi:hypothetical protein